jgi:hypothetical protein
MSNEVIFFVCTTTKESKQQKNKNIKKTEKGNRGKNREIMFWGIFEI